MKAKIILFFAGLLFCFFVYPSAFIYPQDTLPDNNDTRLIAYIIGQVQQNLLLRQPLHYGTFFAPDQNTLAYSDLFLTSAIITLPFRLFTHHPIIIFNLALILGFTLTFFASFLLFDYLFQDFWIALLAVFLFNFSGFHLHYFPHLQMFSLWPVLLALYFFLHSRFTLFFIAVTLQLAESIFPTYLLFFTSLTLFLNPSPSRTLLVGRLKSIFFQALPFLPLWLYLLYPYYRLHFFLPEATRPLRDAAHFSLGLDQLFTQFHSWTVIITFVIASLLSKAWQSIIINTKISGSPRRILLAMTKWRGPKRHIFNPWKYIFLFSLIMSFGPVLKIFGQTIKFFGLPLPLPYALFYYLFPGFTGFRTPSRFIILALLCAVIFICFSLKPYFTQLKSKTKFLFLLLILGLLFTEADLPLKGYPVNIHRHPVYQAERPSSLCRHSGTAYQTLEHAGSRN